jgi:hypothetical protein
MADRLYYVYAIVPPSTAVQAAPTGIDDAPVELIAEGSVAALVGRVDATRYGAGVDERLTDVAWLAPRATAHDTVLTWASDLGAVIPLPLFSMFRSRDAVVAMLNARHDTLASTLDRVGRGREFGVRLFRVDDELRRSLSALSPAVAALEAEVAAAPSPGQGYLLGRKLDAAKKEELRRVAASVAASAYNDLAARSLAATQDPLPKPTAEHTGSAILNASFLVGHDRIDEFREVVTELVRRHHARGFRLEFTGPWPPYHFARSDADVG